MYSNLNGQNIYYQKTGTGKDLILLHGWGENVSTFWPAVELLKDKFTLWLIDLPGFGRSDLPLKALGSSDFAKVVAEFIKKNKIRNPAILGHSFGGKVAIKLVAENPNLINKLILVGASGLKPDLSFQELIIYPGAKFFHFLFPDIFNIKKIIRTKFYRKIESDYVNAGAMKDTLIKTLTEDLTGDLKKIKVETLLLWGDKDRAIPLKYGKRMYQLIRNSKLAVLEGRGHFLHANDPERFSYYVKDFV